MTLLAKMIQAGAARGRVAAAAAFAFALAGSVQAAELIMFERAGCVYCARWNADVAPGYAKTPEGQRAPLRRHDLALGQIQGVELNRPVRFSPTFVLVDNGREVDRITGYMDNASFWGLFAPMIARLAETHSGKAAPNPSAGDNASGKETAHD